jgi:hypothetical protein
MKTKPTKKRKFLVGAILFLLVAAVVVFALYNKESNIPNNAITCKDSQRNSDVCYELYKPVCGYLQVECITTPCDLQPQTFSNDCFACSNSRVKYYTEGACDEKS